MILSLSHIKKSYGNNIILSDCTFHIEDHEKAAVAGVNGAGKSTLFKIIAGEEDADSGEISLGRDVSTGYLSQRQDFKEDSTIYGEMLSVRRNLIDMENQIRELERKISAGDNSGNRRLMEQYDTLNQTFERMNGYAYLSEVNGILKGLGFDENDYDKPVNSLSGGQKTRFALAKLLLSKPDLILLDEPTNHLDITSIKWLENFLAGYTGAVMIVAHDRYFLDRVVNKIIEIDHGKSTVFKGNYSDYAKKKREKREAEIRLYIKQQKEIKRQEEIISKLRSYKQEKFYKRAESREKAVQKMDIMKNPANEYSDMSLKLEPAVTSGKDVLDVCDLTKSFGNRRLFSNVSFTVQRGEHIALVGENGAGKTTLLKIINGLTKADSGNIKAGAQVNIGYYDQEHQTLNNDNTLFDEMSDAYPDLTVTKIRNILAAFMFTGDDVFKTVSELSGGEKGRLSLAKLMLSKANFLILDEPTNHLDMSSKEILEDALNNYTGTVLYVSHDRYFINRTATRILELSEQKIGNFHGDYDYYIRKKEELTAKNKIGSANTKETAVSASKAEYLARKETQAKIRKTKAALERNENQIGALEERLKQIDTMLSDPATAADAEKVTEYAKEQASIHEELDTLYDEWESLSADLDAARAL